MRKIVVQGLRSGEVDAALRGALRTQFYAHAMRLEAMVDDSPIHSGSSLNNPRNFWSWPVNSLHSSALGNNNISMGKVS